MTPKADICILHTDGASTPAPAICYFRRGVLWRVAVHGLQSAVCVGQSRRHVHFAADDLNICPGAEPIPDQALTGKMRALIRVGCWRSAIPSFTSWVTSSAVCASWASSPSLAAVATIYS